MAFWDRFKRKDEAKIGKRNYAGARGGRLYGDFGNSSNSADSELRYALEVLRDRSRELVRDNEYAKRYMQLLKTNVVGDRGFHLQVKARNSDGTLDQSGNAIIENAWKKWGRLGNCTVDGKMSWLDVQRYVIETMARDGECFIRKVRGKNYQDGFSLQMLEADLIDEKKNEHLENGSHIRMGIEMDKRHKITAYWVLTAHPGDRFFQTQSQRHIRVPAEEILHV